MSICIPKELINKIKGYNLDVSTEERSKIFRQFFDEDTTNQLNKAFEGLKLLRNQENVMNKFVDRVSGANAEEKARLRKMITGEIARKKMLMYNMDGSINPNFEAVAGRTDKEIQKFVEDTVNRKYDVHITPEQTAEIVRLDNQVKEAAKLPKMPNGDYDPRYGEALYNMSEYMGEVKDPTANMSLKEQAKYNFDKFKQNFADSQGAFQKSATIAKSGYDFVMSPFFKTVKASIDASFIGVQGTAIMTRNPKLFLESTKKAISAFADKDAMKAFKIDLFSRAGYQDAVKAGLRVLTPEEQFASSAAEKIPVIGTQLIKRSDDAFSLFLQNSRIGEYERVLKNTEEKLGRKLDSKVPEDFKTMKEIADHANKVTGTSNLGSAEKYSNFMNQALFAGRYAVSDIRNFTDILDPTISGEARKRAATTLGLNLGGLYGAYLTYAMVNPDKTEINPNSANFMKVKTDEGVWIGPKLKGQWVIQTIAKLVENSEKSATGKITTYGEGYKPKTKGDVLLHTLRGKLAPVPAVITDIAQGRDMGMNKATPAREISNLISPISAGSIIERYFSGEDSTKAQLQLGFGDAFGFNGYKIGN